MKINECIRRAYVSAQAKGFHDGRTDDGRDDTLIRLGLIHTEVSEAMQVVKRHGTTGYRNAISEELADVAIRLFDLCGCLDIDLEEAIEAKFRKNATRPHKYGTPEESR